MSRKPAKATQEALAFADQATRMFPELAKAIPCFADLSNLIALSLAAEIVHCEAADPAGTGAVWRPGLLLDGDSLAVAAGPTPRQLPALVNVRRARNGAWVFAISGGVEVRPDELARTAEPLEAKEADAWTSLVAENPTWWWDAGE